jgi:hypothetical protein
MIDEQLGSMWFFGIFACDSNGLGAGNERNEAKPNETKKTKNKVELTP